MNKKITIRLLTAVAVIAFFSLNASAQILDDNDWEEGGYGGGASAGQEIDSVTVGSTTGFHVEPDPYYHPNYNTGGSWQITDGTSWNWWPAGASATGTGDYTATVADTNYIAITWGSLVGLDSIAVRENSALACNGDTSYLKVQTIAEPTIGFVGDNNASNILGIDYTACEGDPRLNGSQTVQAELTGIDSIYVEYKLEIWTYNADSSATQYYELDKTTTASAGDSAAAYSRFDSTYVATVLDSLPLVQPRTAGNDISFACITTGGVKSSTVYKYTLLANNGRISRKSDYLSNRNGYDSGWSWYSNFGGGAQTITIIVRPKPDTGPIYHISNTWAN